MKKTARLILAGSLLTLLAGCGGGGGGYDGTMGSDYPKSKYVTFYLQVRDPYGEPAGGATVEIDGFRVDGLTSYDWYAIGPDGPPEWEGWAYNWAVEDYRVVIYEPDDVRRLRVRVARRDLGSQDAWVTISDLDPRVVYVRIVFTLGVGPAQAGALTSAVAEPEYLRPLASDPSAASQ
ncbi:MAG: hypothetical protein N2512_13580 [Armatimonadetes bacterium]|nr:hypothetical protein [Armatimonadota bacterium]